MNPGQKAELNQLMTRLADGDRSVFDSVYALLFPVVQSFAMKFIFSTEDAEDIAQQTLVKIFGQAHKYDRTSDVLPWVLTIASYECKTLRQKYRRSREDVIPPEDLSHLSSNDNTPEESAIDRNLKESLEVVLKGLRVEEQEAIMISILEKSRPDTPAATFRKRLQRSLTALRSAWRAEYGAE